MRKLLGILICCLALASCTKNQSSISIQEKKESDSFSLILEVSKGVFREKEEIVIGSSFKYIGEKDIQLDEKPSMIVVLRNNDKGEVARIFEFNDLKRTMKQGETYNKDIKGIYLEKGNYSAFVQMSFLSVGSSVHKLSTSPIVFEIK